MKPNKEQPTIYGNPYFKKQRTEVIEELKKSVMELPTLYGNPDPIISRDDVLEELNKLKNEK